MYRKTFCQPFLQFFRLLSRGARCCKCTARGVRCQICAPAAAGGQQRHGHTPQKVMTCAAVPPVLQNGVVVYQNVKNAHELERILVAAPVTVGTPAEKMYTAVMLQRDPQNVAYFPEPEEITSIKRMDTPSPTGGRHAPNIFFRDNVSIPDTTVPRGTVNVNTQDMRSGAEYARLPQLVDDSGTDTRRRRRDYICMMRLQKKSSTFVVPSTSKPIEGQIPQIANSILRIYYEMPCMSTRKNSPRPAQHT